MRPWCGRLRLQRYPSREAQKIDDVDKLIFTYASTLDLLADRKVLSASGAETIDMMYATAPHSSPPSASDTCLVCHVIEEKPSVEVQHSACPAPVASAAVRALPSPRASRFGPLSEVG